MTKTPKELAEEWVYQMVEVDIDQRTIIYKSSTLEKLLISYGEQVRNETIEMCIENAQETRNTLSRNQFMHKWTSVGADEVLKNLRVFKKGEKK